MADKIERKTHTIDAAGKVLGRLATEISVLLRGKNNPNFLPRLDMGDFVVVKNIDKIKITGRKLDNKIYYRHSGFLGHLKKTTMRKLIEKKPGEPLRQAVLGMLPKNKLRAKQIKRLKIR
jgi:large subunit ribosomal protein L13